MSKVMYAIPYIIALLFCILAFYIKPVMAGVCLFFLAFAIALVNYLEGGETIGKEKMK